MTSDLDEYTIAALSGAPVDGYGVGTALVTGSGHPTCGFVYKLVARAESDEQDAPLVGGGQEEHRQDIDRRSQVRRCAGSRAEGIAELELIGIGRRPTERPRRPRAAGAAGDRRRDRRVRSRSRRPGSGTTRSRRSCRSRR